MTFRMVTAERAPLLGSWAARLAWISAFALLTGVGAWIRIPLPFTPVPITLQTLFVLGSGVILGRDGVYSQLLYLVLGGIGLPLFAGGSAHFQYILGPTGGYLIGFVAASALASSWVRSDWVGLGFFRRALRLLAVSFVIFVPGVVQLAWVTGGTLMEAISIGFVPFLFGDLVKVLAVAGIPHKALRRP